MATVVGVFSRTVSVYALKYKLFIVFCGTAGVIAIYDICSDRYAIKPHLKMGRLLCKWAGQCVNGLTSNMGWPTYKVTLVDGSYIYSKKIAFSEVEYIKA